MKHTVTFCTEGHRTYICHPMHDSLHDSKSRFVIRDQIYSTFGRTAENIYEFDSLLDTQNWPTPSYEMRSVWAMHYGTPAYLGFRQPNQVDLVLGLREEIYQMVIMIIMNHPHYGRLVRREVNPSVTGADRTRFNWRTYPIHVYGIEGWSRRCTRRTFVPSPNTHLLITICASHIVVLGKNISKPSCNGRLCVYVYRMEECSQLLSCQLMTTSIYWHTSLQRVVRITAA